MLSVLSYTRTFIIASGVVFLSGAGIAGVMSAQSVEPFVTAPYPINQAGMTPYAACMQAAEREKEQTAVQAYAWMYQQQMLIREQQAQRRIASWSILDSRSRRNEQRQIDRDYRDAMRAIDRQFDDISDGAMDLYRDRKRACNNLEDEYPIASSSSSSFNWSSSSIPWWQSSSSSSSAWWYSSSSTPFWQSSSSAPWWNASSSMNPAWYYDAQQTNAGECGCQMICDNAGSCETLCRPNCMGQIQ